MGLTIKMAAIGAVAFMVLDGVWLGLLMKNVLPRSARADRPPRQRWHRAQLAGGARRLCPARDRHRAFRHPARADRAARGRLRRAVRTGRLRRLRLHQLLDAAAVAVGAGVCRRRVGRRGISGVRGGRPDRGPVSKPRPRALPDPRRLQTDGNQHRYAARLGAASWRGHPRPRRARADVHGRRCRAPAAVAAGGRAGTQHRAPRRAHGHGPARPRRAGWHDRCPGSRSGATDIARYRRAQRGAAEVRRRRDRPGDRASGGRPPSPRPCSATC